MTVLAARQILALVGTVYPAYATAKATTTKDGDELARWCQYWLIFAIVSLVSFAVDMVGTMLPFYWEARVFFALWLVADKFKGATFLCEKYMEPFLTKHQPTIDSQIDFVMERAKDLKSEDVRKLAEWAQAKAQGQAAKPAAAAAKKAVEKAAKAVEQTAKPQDPDDVVDVSAEAKKED